MSSSILSILFSLKAKWLHMYFVLLWLCVLYVLGLVHSLLLDSLIGNKVRDRTGAAFVGGGLGGIFEWNYYKLYNLLHYQSKSPSSYFSYFSSILFDNYYFYFSKLCSFFFWLLFAFLFLFLFLFLRAFNSLSLTASASYWTTKHSSDDYAQEFEHVNTNNPPQSRSISLGETKSIFYVIWS